MTNTELMQHHEVLDIRKFDGDGRGPEFIGFGVTSLVGALVANGGDIETLNVQIFPSRVDGQDYLELNVTMNKLPEEDNV